MTVEQSVRYLNLVANQDLTPIAVLHKVITVNGTVAASAVTAVGALKSQGASGESVTAAYDGVIKMFAGAAISTVGYPITVTTSGYVIAASSGGYTVGKAYATANSGDLVPCMCDFAQLGTYQGN